MGLETRLSSLIQLLDDPDVDVYQPVAQEILKMGSEAVSALQDASQQNIEVLAKERIQELLLTIRFQALKEDLIMWLQTGAEDLMQGVLIANRFGYPDEEDQAIVNQIEELKREVWLQMQYEMSPLDQVRILNQVLFVENDFHGNAANHAEPENSYLHDVLDRRTGNQIMLAVVYMMVAQRLDIPIYGVNLPQHFVLAYTSYSSDTVLFYINAFNNGEVFARGAIDDFLVQLNIKPVPEFYAPCDNITIVNRILRNLINSYTAKNDVVKVERLNQLIALIKEAEEV